MAKRRQIRGVSKPSHDLVQPGDYPEMPAIYCNTCTDRGMSKCNECKLDYALNHPDVPWHYEDKRRTEVRVQGLGFLVPQPWCDTCIHDVLLAEVSDPRAAEAICESCNESYEGQQIGSQPVLWRHR